MFQKFFEEIGPVCFGSLMLTSNMNKSGVEDSFTHLQEVSRQPDCRSAAQGRRPRAGAPAVHHA